MDLTIEEIVAHLTPAGRLEWELAATRAMLAKSEQEKSELLALLESQTRNDGAESVEP